MGTINSGVDIGAIFKAGQDSLSTEGAALKEKMNAIAKGESLEPEQLMEMQFAMGQYNAKVEAFSSITKSLLDTLKSLAQRSG